jgi:hypothetical protein
MAVTLQNVGSKTGTEIVPADGIRLPFLLGAETSERRRFLGST